MSVAPRLVLTVTEAMGIDDWGALPGGLLELRLDRFRGSAPGGGLLPEEARALVGRIEAAAPARELLLTCAPAATRAAAGGFRGRPAERLALLGAACEAASGRSVRVDLDAELADWLITSGEPETFGAAGLVLSEHLEPAALGTTADALEAALDRALEASLLRASKLPAARVVKLVPLLDDSLPDGEAGLVLLAWLRTRRERWRARGLGAAVFAAGAAGTFTRSLCTAFGSDFVYAAAARDGESPVPGQPTAVELVSGWPTARPPSDGARVYGVLGRRVAASLSPQLFTRLLAAHGGPVERVYGRFDLEDVGALFGRLEAGLEPLQGLSVTAPHKGAAWLFGSGASAPPGPGLARLGALNTLLRPAGDGAVWRGANTDLDGVRAAATELLGEAFEARARELVVVGAGGAARAVLAALGGPHWRGRTTVLARDARRAMGLAREFGAGFGALESLAGLAPDLLVHATPAGSAAAAAGSAWVPGAAALAELAERAPECRVLDANYAPDPTPLVGAARALGLVAAGGRTWFLAQALAQFELFCGAPFSDAARARLILEQLLAARAAAPHAPIVLMGLRGAGKSSAGRALAARLGRPFVDLDEALAAAHGAASAGALFESVGEAAFRELEAELFEARLGEPLLVLAAGGGLFTRARARAAFGASAASGIWLDADPRELARRVAADPSLRPALFGTDPESEARRAHAERSATFEALAGAPLDTTDATPEQVLELLLARTQR